MPTTTAGLYEVILEQKLFGGEIKNVFHYLATLGQDDEQDKIADAFNNTIPGGLQDITTSDLTFDLIRVSNLTGLLADATMVPSSTGGNLTGETMAEFISMPFRYDRTTKETRNGAKRFCGCIEEAALDNRFTGSHFTLMQTFAVILAGQISATGIIAEPVILRKPDISGVWLYNDVSNVVAVNRQTTQNSRKSF